MEPSVVTVTTDEKMKTATHDGHCQVCGRLQRLPGGTLAKHGYEVHGRKSGGYGGYFSGECWGSHALPFQESCELVKLSIARANAEIERLTNKQDELRKPATEPTGPVSVYFTSRYFGRGYYAWVEGKVVADGDFFKVAYTGTTDKGEEKTVSRRAYDFVSYMVANDALSIASALRQKYAEALNKELDELGEYIRMQQLRVDSWKPHPLIPRK